MTLDKSFTPICLYVTKQYNSVKSAVLMESNRSLLLGLWFFSYVGWLLVCLRGVFTTRHYTNPRLPYLTWRQGSPHVKNGIFSTFTFLVSTVRVGWCWMLWVT